MNICQNNQGLYIIMLAAAFLRGGSGDDGGKQQRDKEPFFVTAELKKSRFATTSSERELSQGTRDGNESPNQSLDGHQLPNQLPEEGNALNHMNRGKKGAKYGSQQVPIAKLELAGEMEFRRPLQSLFHSSGIDPQPGVDPPLLFHFPHAFLVSTSHGPRILQANPFTHPLGLRFFYSPTNLLPVPWENDFYQNRGPIVMIPLTTTLPIRMLGGQFPFLQNRLPNVDRGRHFLNETTDPSLQRELHEGEGRPSLNDGFRIRNLGPGRPFQRETETVVGVQSKASLELPFSPMHPKRSRILAPGPPRIPSQNLTPSEGTRSRYPEILSEAVSAFVRHE